MLIRIILFSLLLLPVTTRLSSQPLAITFQEAESKGIYIRVLDSLYLSAVHVDSTLAVFKTPEEQSRVHAEYVRLLQSLGDFLSANNFEWEKPAACFNRIYFSPGGNIDYYVFNFRGKPEDKPSPEKEKEFTRLVNLFIQDFKIDLRAHRKFAQCSPTTFMPRR